MKRSMRYSGSLLAGLTSLLLVAGCGTEGASELTMQSDSLQSGLGLTPPAFLLQRAINEQALSPRVIVNDQTVSMSRTAPGSSTWSGVARVVEGSSVAIDITWMERVGVRDLELATVSRQFAEIRRNESVSIAEDEYQSSNLDFDMDEVSNLTERVEGSDPFDATDPGSRRPQVLLPMIDPGDAPDIDGQYDTIWNSAEFLDRNDRQLSIDNLMVDQGATRMDGDTEFQWAGMHDGEFLYLIVFGELAETRMTFGDSEEVWHDDTLDIFLDGDNSNGTTYDGVNDFHILLPILKGENIEGSNRSGDSDTRLDFGNNSVQTLPGLDFATCLCSDDRDIWEVRIRLSDVGIQVDEPFGIDLQLNEDKDGGDREAKWGWEHPSRVDFDVDETWRNPSFMGTAELQAPIL